MAFALATNEPGAQAAARFSGQGFAGSRPPSCVQPFAREHWLPITWGDLTAVEFARGEESEITLVVTNAGTVLFQPSVTSATASGRLVRPHGEGDHEDDD